MGEVEELKAQILEEASSRPERFFPVKSLRERGFERSRCKACEKYFWSTDESREVCGEARCSGGYTFIDSPPTQKSFSYTSAWNQFKKFMEKRGYTAINRYPVLARWRKDTEFVRASIYDFQPYVVSGEVDPPANPLIIPQPSLRFNDIDNVGITGGHYVLHDHIGQHAFEESDDYDQERYFTDILEWLKDGMGVPEEKIIIHEDAWGGGGNLGTSMEFFVGGLELLNQVYMFYEIDSSEQGYSELDIKVLDMGMGHERIVWLSKGDKTSYEANMPMVVERLYKKTGVKPDEDIRKRFLPYSGLLNTDDVEDTEAKWQEISKKINIDKNKLKNEIQTSADIYSVADHTRALLFAFVDGALPSNTGEKHSLRVITRRALDIVDKNNWDLDLKEIMEWHAEELKGLFPELKENLGQAKMIMKHEERKYKKARNKAKNIIKNLGDEILDEKKLIELYDTYGISPELLERFGVEVTKPKDFYSKISERHDEEREERIEENGFNLENLPSTKKLYLEDEKKISFSAKVVDILEKNSQKYVILDQTCFYPTQGGQMNDTGTINGSEVIDTVNKGGIILHKVDDIDLEKGDIVKGRIDWERRKQLMQHHTSTHIINGAATEVLGDHVSQAGAKKTENKARLDITHYEKLSKDELERIETVAKKWIEEGYKVNKSVLKKSDAEKLYGFKIYQGGVPPGNELRIINIGDGLDVEACGGTHVDNTSEIEDIVLINNTKIQDGVIRLEYKSGKAANTYRKEREAIRKELDKTIDVEDYDLEELGNIFDVPVNRLIDVVNRFSEEREEKIEKIENLKEILDGKGPTYGEKPRDPEKLFKEWKQGDKDLDKLEGAIIEKAKNRIRKSKKDFVKEDVPVENLGRLIKAVEEETQKQNKKAVLIRGKRAAVASKGSSSDHDIRKEMEKEADVVKEENGLLKGFDLK